MKKFQTFMILLLLCLLPSLRVSATEIREPTNLPDSITNDVDESQTDRYETTSPWMSGNEDHSIYSNTLEGGNGSSTQIEPDTPGKVEKYVSELLRNIASSIIGLLNDYLGASLDSIVYGRVGSGYPNRVNIFSFELRKGNPYGVTGAVAYSVLRSMAYVFMGLQFIGLLAKASFTGYTAKSREELKTAFYTLVLNFCLLALMPFFLDIGLYIRDVLLYGLKEVTSQLITGGGTLNLSDAFYMVSENSGTFVDAVMYLGTVALTIYFTCIYVSVAMDMLICFVVFPLTCVLGKQNKSNLEIWCVNILSDICTPVIDAVLLLVPLLTSVMLSDVIAGVQIIQLIMCTLVIPMRGQIKEKLGLGKGGERYGMFGAMAGFAVGRMIGNRIKAGVGKLKEAYGDAKKSREYGELAEIDRAEEESLVSDYNRQRGYTRDTDLPQNTSAGENDLELDETEKAFNLGEDSGITDQKPDLDSAERQLDGVVMNPMEEIQNDKPEEVENESDISTLQTPQTIPQTKEDIAKDLQNAIDTKETEIADMRVEKAGYQQKEKEQRLAMIDMEAGTEPFKQAQKQAAEYALKAGETEKKIQKASKQLSQLKGQSARISGVAKRGNTGTVSDFDAKRAEILAKHANITNFEQPEFKGVLSNARRKELYQARAVRTSIQTAAGLAGAVGGGVLMGSMGSFMPASTSLMMMAGGTAIGSTAARAGADAVLGSMHILKNVMPAESEIPESGGGKSAPVVSGVHIDMETTGGQEGEARLDKEPAAISEKEGGQEAQPEITARMEEVQREAVLTLRKMMTSDSSKYNNLVIRALKEANLQVETYFAALDEDTRAGITQEETQIYRIEMQTEKIVETLLGRMSANGNLEKNSSDYKYAKEFLMERVSKIVEQKNQRLL